MKIFNILREAGKRKLSPVRTLGSTICRCFTVYYLLFTLLTFSSMSNIRTVKSAGLYALNESALRRYLEHVLELSETGDRSVTGERPPHYVQELYDTLADENDRYGRGYVPYKDGLFTVQAVTQDYKEYDSRQKDDFSVNLNFPLTKLWMKSTGVARAELVLELNRQALLSLPPRHYALNIETQTLPASRADRRRVAAREERDYFSRRLSDNSDHFTREFVVLNVTRALRKTSIWRQQERPSRNFALRFDVRLSVTATDYAPPPEADSNFTSSSSSSATTTTQRDLLDARQVAAFFYTNARRDRSQPLLVLYSSDDDVYVYRRGGRVNDDEDWTRDESFVERRRRKRQRREIQRESEEKSHVENGDPESQPTCGLRGWPVDLSGLLHQRLMMPKRVNVNYCSGVCPFPVYDSHWNATNNAVIRSSFIYVRGQMTPAYVPDPMCVPRTLNSMSFLFSENNNIVVRILEQVVATSCMCA